MEKIKSDRSLTYFWLYIGIGVLFSIIFLFVYWRIPVLGIIIGIVAVSAFAANNLYKIYFYYNLSLDVDTVCKGDGIENGSYLVAAALSTLTFGLYNIYWTYKIGQRLHVNAPRYGFKIVETGKDIAVLDAFSFGYISAYELLKNMNRIARVYNQNGNNQENPDYVYGGEV